MIRLAVGVAALAMSAAALAQEADPPLEQIVVLPLPRVDVILVQGAGLPWIEGGDSVEARTVVTDGRPGLGARVENRLRDEAGLVQFRRSDSRSAHPTSQGVTLRGLGGNASSRALVTLDGVPQADPFGGWARWRVPSPSIHR